MGISRAAALGSRRLLRPEPTCVEVFALDAESGEPAYAGLELVDGGNGVAGLVVYEGQPPRTWTDPQ